MDITKFGHACLYLEKNTTGIIVDPGNLTGEFSVPSGLEAILITHMHPDHVHSQNVKDIMSINPGAKVYGHISALQTLDGVVPASQLHSVVSGNKFDMGNFKVEFTGGQHAIIHPDIARIDNLGIMIDDGYFFYPGDALEVSSVPVKVLALPASAPWMKISETLDYLSEVHPENAIPVHDGILSEGGKSIIDNMLKSKAEAIGVDYQRIDDLGSSYF